MRDWVQMTEYDWREFEQRFPDAMSFLRHKALERELQFLRERKEGWGIKLNDWQEKRLVELEALERSWKDASRNHHVLSTGTD